MRYTPFEDVDRMFDQMRRSLWSLSDEEYAAPWRSTGGSAHLDLTEREDEFVLMADLPGFEKEEIGLQYEDGVLFLAAEHEVADEESARSRRVREQVSLPKDVEEEKIEAHYRNGVLEVHLPFAKESKKRGRSIDIRD